MLSLEFKTLFERTLGLITDPTILDLEPYDLKELQKEWLFRALSDPRITNLFSSITVDESNGSIEFELNSSNGDFSDKNFITELLSMGMVIAWLQPQVDSKLNTAAFFGGKEEKKLKDDYKALAERLNAIKTQQHKIIRDRGYIKNPYINGE